MRAVEIVLPLLALVLAFALPSDGLGLAAGVSATEDTFRVIVPAASLNSGTPDGGTLSAGVGSLAVVVGETTCGILNLTDSTSRLPSGDKFIDIGSNATQPSLCHSEGARVTFFDGHGRELSFESVLQLGHSVTVSNLAPKPPGSATRGLILGSLSVEGRGLVTGRSTGFGNLLFLVIPPADRPQPAQLANLEWAAAVNEYGLFAKVLDPGDYWIVPLNLVLLSPNESIRVQKANGEQQVGVIRVHVSAGAATRADIVVTAGSYDNPPTPVAVTAPSELQVTPPRDGSAAGSQPGLRPPVTGTAGLKPLR